MRLGPLRAGARRRVMERSRTGDHADPQRRVTTAGGITVTRRLCTGRTKRSNLLAVAARRGAVRCGACATIGGVQLHPIMYVADQYAERAFYEMFGFQRVHEGKKFPGFLTIRHGEAICECRSRLVRDQFARMESVASHRA